MKITKIDVFVVDTKEENIKASLFVPIGCRIYTDAGIYGDGEAASHFFGGLWGTVGLMQLYAQRIIGMDPMENDVIWERIYKGSFWTQGGGLSEFSAMSALDIALWDIRGKVMKQPIYKLLGGKHRDELRCYASQTQFDWPKVGEEVTAPRLIHDPKDFAESAKKAIEEGFDAVKVDFFMVDGNGEKLDYRTQTGLLSPKMLDMIEARLAATREAIGSNCDIIIESHSFTDANSAIQIMQMAEPYNILFFEEPNTPTPQTARYIKSRTNIPIANGERIFTRWQYLPYFQDGTIQVGQPDIGTCGGITEVKKICDMGHTFDVLFQAHCCGTALSTDVALHLESSIPNFIIHEYHTNTRWKSSIGFTKSERYPVDGYFTVSEEPGIGNEWLQETIDKAYIKETLE